MPGEYDYLFVVGIYGGSGVGKSQLINRFVKDNYEESYISSIRVDFCTKCLDVNDQKVKLQIWENKALTLIDEQSAPQACVVLYDCTDMQSFNDAKTLINKLKNNDMPIILVGTKSDCLYRKIVFSDIAQDYANQNGLKFYEVSAKTDSNMDKIFQNISLDLMKKLGYKEATSNSSKNNVCPNTTKVTNPNHSKDDLKSELTNYISKRQKEQNDRNFDDYNRFAQFFSFRQKDYNTANAKIAAATKALKLLDPSSESLSFSKSEMQTLSHGRLGRFFKEQIEVKCEGLTDKDTQQFKIILK
jgi:small GTP-binding protein